MARDAPASVVGKVIGPIGYGLMGMDLCLPTAPSIRSSTLSIKGAYDAKTHQPDGSPEGIRTSVNQALAILSGVKKIDIFECARVDPNVPIETSIAALVGLVNEEKIGGIGISEVGAGTIRRAHKVHRIAAAEIELVLFTVEACHELNIPIIAYSPLGRDWLTGKIRKYSDLASTDTRHLPPRFQPEVFDYTVKLVEARVRENVQDVVLKEGELGEIGNSLKGFVVKGERYGGVHERSLNL
ncbi:NADP-dependent oxidoreductase domain-containing protein [Aspergillus spectabilis]